MRYKTRKLIFWGLIATMASSSMLVYAGSNTPFFLKTVELVLFQQMATVVIFLLCFGIDLIRASKT